MCLIVDVNVAHRIISLDPDPDYKPIQDVLFRPRGRNEPKLVLGGKLTAEYREMSGRWRVVQELDNQGRVEIADDQEVETETRLVKESGLCTSDDPHIIGLARVSNTHLLCSNDNALVRDFKNKRLIDNPRGRVYSKPSHKRLIREQCMCKRSDDKR